MLETLVRGGRTVQELQEELTLDQPVASQQLAVLRNQGIVSARKEGVSVRYTLSDPLVGELLFLARQIFNNQLIDLQASLEAQLREDELLAATVREPARGEPEDDKEADRRERA